MWNLCDPHDVKIEHQCNALDVKIKRERVVEYIASLVMENSQVCSNSLGEHGNDRPHNNIEHVEIALYFEVAMKIEKKISKRSVLDIGQKIEQFEIGAVIDIVKIERRDADGVIKYNATVDSDNEKKKSQR
ncbi:hypothetical protein AB685_09420 [Bacillus sp. LL01]|nr:hypothetical protein AB685_09420 [Bacillus sp. LL01]